MNLLAKSFSAVALMSAFSFKPVTTIQSQPIAPSKIQVAILLDVSGSMDGLIEQAKAQLWNMLTTLGKADGKDKS